MSGEMSHANYAGRLAPSPTGLTHLGTARTALMAFLRTRSVSGRLLMRIEDIDTPRVVAGSAETIVNDLKWLGIEWDGEPVFQSRRFALYERAIEQLRTAGHAYPCTCSRKEILAIASAPHADDHNNAGDNETRYPGTCRSRVSHDDGRTPSWRFRMPDREPGFTDQLHGQQSGREASDFVIKRADGVFAYQLAVVVDDIEMGVTEVVRGDDLLSSTPRQIALYQALGAPVPTFLHVPLMLGEDGVRLAKRHGAVSISQLRNEGHSPESIIGFLAFTLGLLDRIQPISARELVAAFDLTRVHREPTRLTLPIPR